MDLKKVYDFLESQDGGTEMVDVIKGELFTSRQADKKYRDLKKDYEDVKGKFDEVKPLIEFASENKLNVDSLKGLIDNSRKDETELDKVLREFDILKSENKQIKESLQEKEKKAQDLEKQNNATKLKDVFRKEMGNIIPKILDNELDAFINRGDISFDSEGQPKGKIDGEFFDVKSFAERYTAKNPEFISSNKGLGNEHSSANPGSDGGYGDKSEKELLSEVIKSI